MLETLLVGTQSKSGGQIMITAFGTTTWVVPVGVTTISAVTIGRGYNGGGGLSWRSAIPVTPGETLSIQHTTATGGIYRGGELLLGVGCGAAKSGGLGGKAFNDINDGGGNGGAGAGVADTYVGGGAGGYSGNGGNAAIAVTTLGGYGAGGGGSGGSYWSTFGNGGGVSPLGYNGRSGVPNGAGDPNGAQGSSEGTYRTMEYGGGSWNAPTYIKPTDYNGVTRIIWGEGRFYPSTNCKDV